MTSAIPYLVMASTSRTWSEAGAVEVAFSAMLPPLEVVVTVPVVAVLLFAAVRMGGEESKGLLRMMPLLDVDVDTTEFTLNAWVALVNRANFRAIYNFIFAQYGVHYYCVCYYLLSIGFQMDEYP